MLLVDTIHSYIGPTHVHTNITMFYGQYCGPHINKETNMTLIIPISACYYLEFHIAITIQLWECNILPSKVIYGL